MSLFFVQLICSLTCLVVENTEKFNSKEYITKWESVVSKITHCNLHSERIERERSLSKKLTLQSFAISRIFSNTNNYLHLNRAQSFCHGELS